MHFSEPRPLLNPGVDMTRGSAIGGNAETARGGKPKRSTAPKPLRHRVSPAVDQETEVVRLTRELGKAIEQQTATGDILKVIAGSPDNVQPVFDAIARNANRLVG